MSKRIETDNWTFIRFWAIPAVAYLLYLLVGKASTGLVVIGISILLALALKPLVRKVNNFFTKHFGSQKKHQTLSAVFAYLIVILVIGAIIAIVGPVVVNETTKFVQHFPETFEQTFGGWEGINKFGESIGIKNLHDELFNTINSMASSILGFLSNNFLSNVSSMADILMKVALVLVLTLLFLLEGPEIMETIWSKLSSNDNKKTIVVAKRVISKMANVVSIYFSRQVVVAMIDGLASGLIVFVLSLFLNISTTLAVPMGMTTMMFYMIPMFGQFIGGTLVTLILLFSNPLGAAIFAIIYIIYAQIENNFIAPKVQGDALHLQPILILCAITIGMYMFGLLGAIIAIPIAGCIRILIDEYPNIKAARE